MILRNVKGRFSASSSDHYNYSYYLPPEDSIVLRFLLEKERSRIGCRLIPGRVVVTPLIMVMFLLFFERQNMLRFLKNAAWNFQQVPDPGTGRIR